MFNKILIANRGAIACRIIRTLNKMNIASVAVYAEADADSLHVEHANESFSLGEGPAAQTYLDQEKIIAVAKQCGAQAIHPGYGFLSENPSFVNRCKEEGIVFIGPSVENMNAFSLKHTARELAEQHNVPLVPGTDLLNDKQSAIDAAQRIGFPIILKSSAGGGGIGMQVCRSVKEVDEAFDSVKRLSENNFSDSRVFLEKYIENARHIEVQAFGNGLGDAIDLGERDCSLQRRNQKVIEEAPAPNLDDSIRKSLHATATRLLSGIKYANAGTVEFIFDTKDGTFYFLEVNTRLQVEHGVTEEVYQVDLVEWMIEQAYSPITDLLERKQSLKPHGHAIQARIYAENPNLNFQPSAGLLSHVSWNEYCPKNKKQRIDTWIRSGVEVSPFFDPMLSKVIVWAEDRNQASKGLQATLSNSQIYGIETNLDYCLQLLSESIFLESKMTTRFLNEWQYCSETFEVLSPGTLTSIQDTPGRVGYWEVGVPPSGPFDNFSFNLGNQALGNQDDCAGLEITIQGPTLKFNIDTQAIVTGAELDVTLDGETKSTWQSFTIKAGQTLALGKIKDKGARAYLLLKDGIQCPDYLGSKSTFTLGQFGGHSGRALRTGDVLKLPEQNILTLENKSIKESLRPKIKNHWSIDVVYGPHGAPDFFSASDIETFFKTDWEVHYNSSRTGIRLIGPKPEWARETGGEAGMHPSNIHDNAYAFGTVDFTGDMPVILGPDGPSLGGFVCPATVISSDLWKLGQLRAGDKIRFHPVSIEDAVEKDQHRRDSSEKETPLTPLTTKKPESCIIENYESSDQKIVVRPAGDHFLLVEFGEQILDLRLRMQVYALREYLNSHIGDGIIDLTPGIRSLQIHFDPLAVSHKKLLEMIQSGVKQIENMDDLRIPSRIVHLPLSWDDEACQEAVDKYMQSVRKDAPWCPNNIEFIRRINGLDSIQDVKDIVFNANYVVMGLGDVYLGAPVATPMDPRHRLVTTKYNPARTWTAENSVGIGGAYLCVYGMEGPGGYQFVGRTLQMWNRYRETREFSQPWLLRFFDQIKFYPVTHDELVEIRQNFPKGHYPLKIEETEFSLREFENFRDENQSSIDSFVEKRSKAFDEELQRWRDSGQFHFDSTPAEKEEATEIPDDMIAVDSAVAGNVWKLEVEEGQLVEAGQVIAILESMKMEIEIRSPSKGTVTKILKNVGANVSAGQALMLLQE